MESGSAARFWEKVQKAEGGCWLWMGRRYHDGYGEFAFSGSRKKMRRAVAHRVAWELANGRPIAPGKFICHRCDNPPCVNPDHLFEGTQRDNVADMVAKGRAVPPPPGAARRSLAKISEADVLRIRELAADSAISWIEVSSAFGISESAARSIASGSVWAELGGTRTPPGSKPLGRRRLEVSEGHAWCSRCKAEKPASEFYPSVAAKGRGWCAACYSKWQTQRGTNA